MVKCLICDKELISLKALSQHIRFHNISSKDYYDRFLTIDEKEKYCKYCGKETNFRNISLGYQNFCNLKCSNNDEERKEKFRQSYLSNDLSIVKETREQTNLKRYGNRNANLVEDIKNRNRESFLKKQVYKKIKELEEWKIICFDDLEKVSRNDVCSFKCNICGKLFNDTIQNIWQRMYKCSCRAPEFGSVNENILKDFIKQLLPEVSVLFNQKIEGLEADIVVPELSMVFEYNGLYWHSEKILKDPINYHNIKRNIFKKNGYRLIQIFEDEWVFRNKIVKDRIRHIVGYKNIRKIFARNCIIKEIDYKTKESFLNENHLQGNDVSFVNLGVFFKDELVAVMTFSKGSISKGSRYKEGVWELSRFCVLNAVNCVGIAGKLLSYFKKKYDWQYIYSYADKRWSEGNLYIKLGFDFEKETRPNYWYTKDGFKRIHRFKLRKKETEPKEISEWELRKQEGFYKIWDCGNMKFSMTNYRRI
jgi:hypothetical protein